MEAFSDGWTLPGDASPELAYVDRVVVREEDKKI